jgi:ribose transport system permease protein
MSTGGLFTRWRSIGFAVVLLVILLVVNLWLNPARFHPAAWGALVGLAAPLIGAALASAPVILSGRGGIDISVGPLMGFVNAVVIQVLFLKSGIATPLLLIPAALLVGAAIGAINGFLTTIVRIQPIVATLGTC